MAQRHITTMVRVLREAIEEALTMVHRHDVDAELKKALGATEVTVYWLDDSGAIPAGMSEDLSGWWWGIGMDGLNSYCDGPFATKQEAIAASQTEVTA